MMELTIIGWKPGLRTISLMDTLRANCGMGLRQAKEAVEHLLDGGEIQIPDLGEDRALALRREIEAAGAVCR
jgi:hypothetical protein